MSNLQVNTTQDGLEEPKITLSYTLPEKVRERLTKNLQVYTTQ